jgi:hypothetical protein
VDDGRLAAQPGERLGHLAADRPAADDDQRLGHSLEIEEILVGEVIDVGETGDRRHQRAGAGGDEDAFGGQRLRANLDRVWVDEFRVAFLEEEIDLFEHPRRLGVVDVHYELTVGYPNGRNLPLAFGIYTRRTAAQAASSTSVRYTKA